MTNFGLKVFAAIALLPDIGLAQSVDDLWALRVPESIALSPDGSRLWYRLGKDLWQIGTGENSRPKRVDKQETAPTKRLPQVVGTRRSNPRRSPDGKKVAYLDTEKPYGPLLLFCVCDNQQEASPRLCRGSLCLNSSGPRTQTPSG